MPSKHPFLTASWLSGLFIVLSATACSESPDPGPPPECPSPDDEDVPTNRYYTDADGDGYGDPEQPVDACELPPGAVENDDDCDDSNGSIYPGALDAAGDGVDSSCDGIDGLAPSVGLPTSTFTSLQAALDAASDGQTVWVGPGTYRESNLSMEGKGLLLRSTEGAEMTIIDAQSLAPVMLFYKGEDKDSKLEGFTITGGSDKNGGGLYLNATSPVLKGLIIRDNVAEYSLGGLYLEGGSEPSLEEVSIEGNSASSGGGIYLYGSSPTLKNGILAYNRASSGGNLYRYDTSSTATLNNSLLYNPSGWGRANFTPSGSYLTVEPQFLEYANTGTGASCTLGSSTSCLPFDLHPAQGSPLINAGAPASTDADSSRADIGSYGGPAGDQWDVDGDETPDYFWPGEWDDAPSGFDPHDYDCDELDPEVQGC